MVTGHSSPGQRLIEEGRAQMARDLASGVAGVEACRSLSRVYDMLVQELWSAAMLLHPEASECGFALIALGGWGREEICPYSDIDFVLLAEPKHAALAQEFADKILYPLWDAKAKVGHALRSVADAARLAREDLPTATSLLDGRLVVGDASSFERLVSATRQMVAPGGNANAFVQELRNERERRYERFGDSLYLLEPNIKQGIGGLRDFATAHWAARARWSVASLADLVALGELTKRQAEVMTSGLDFLLSLRCLVQLEAGRATDQLSFEIQERVGPTLFPHAVAPVGKIVPAVAPAVEDLMRKYYLTGRGIERVTNRVVESATVPERRKPRIHKIDRSFLTWNGKLAVTDPKVFREQPAEMLRYFRVARQENLPLYGHTKELIEAQVAETGHLLAGHPQAARLFLDALVDVEDARPLSLLREMHVVGLLAAVMPDFGPCTGRVQHDLYHVYTVDHHQLFAVELLKRTARGELDVEGSVAMQAYRELTNVETLYLGTLLHDVGKPLGAGHAENGARVASEIAKSLGMSEQEVAMVDFLVRQHLTMSHVSQRRDLSDPDVISKFAAKVGDAQALRQLFLLTRCDTAMTSPGNLSAWKDQLLSELYLRTLARLQGSAQMDNEQALHRRQARQRAVEIVSRQGKDLQRAASAETIIDRLDPSFVNSLSARQLARAIECLLRRVQEGHRIAISARVLKARGQTELISVAEDSKALLSHVCGVLSAHRVVIDNASITSLDSPYGPLAMQVFFVRNDSDLPIDADDRRWTRVESDLRKLLEQPDRKAFVERLLAKREDGIFSLKPAITSNDYTEVKVFDRESSEFSVIEVHTNDDLGLLYRLAGVLADQGLDIYRSMIGTEGDRVADVFYVQRNGRKLDEDESIAVHDALMKAFGSAA